MTDIMVVIAAILLMLGGNHMITQPYVQCDTF